MNSFIYFRALKHAEHTVFCVEDGQKTYKDPQFKVDVPYSSGQQVKHSLLQSLIDNLNLHFSPVTFNYKIKDNKLESKEAWSICDPTFVDQLIGGWMSAGNGITKKRRSPLSVSAMRPLHPLLANISQECITFDRNNNTENNTVIVRMDGRDEPLSKEEIETYLQSYGRSIPNRIWIPQNKRASGFFVHDIAIDLRTLFCVSTNQFEPEVSPEMIEELKGKGWIVSKNVFGECLVMPKEEREKVIPALAKALINWHITSNQARTFSLMETLAVAISDNANTLAAAIRAKLIEDGEKSKAKPIVDETAGADLYVTLPCSAYIVTESESATALKDAENKLIEMIRAFDFENQQ